MNVVANTLPRPPNANTYLLVFNVSVTLPTVPSEDNKTKQLEDVKLNVIISALEARDNSVGFVKWSNRGYLINIMASCTGTPLNLTKKNHNWSSQLHKCPMCSTSTMTHHFLGTMEYQLAETSNPQNPVGVYHVSALLYNVPGSEQVSPVRAIRR